MNFADRGRYDPRAQAGGFASEVDRLEAQAALSWEAEAELVGRLIAGANPRILEVGSGSGAVTERIARTWPEASLVALEPHADLLATARDRLAWLDTVEWTHGSIVDNNLPAGAFDLILVRYVLQHLDDPVAALAALRLKLAPGGRLVAIDIDGELWGAAEPGDPALAAIHAAAGHNRVTGDRLIGRRLWGLLRDAGYADCKLESFCYHSGTLGLKPFGPQLNPERLTPAVLAGDLPYADYLLLLDAHHRFMADPNAFCMMLGFAAHGG